MDSIVGLATCRPLRVVNKNGQQTWTAAGESGCARSESLYVFTFSLWVSLGFLVFPSVYDFPLSSWFLYGSMSVSFLWVYVILMFFPLGLCYSYVLLGLGLCCSNVLSGLRIRLYRRGEVASHKGPGRSCAAKIRF